MFSNNSFWFNVWKLTKYKLTEYHFITGKLWVMVMIGICLNVAATASEVSYFFYLFDSNGAGRDWALPLIMFWLVYISIDLGKKSYKSYDLFLSSTPSISFLSSYFYLLIIAFISAVVAYLSKYPVLLILLILSPNDWLLLNEGLTSFLYYVSSCFVNFLLFVTLGFMVGIIGSKIIAVFIAIVAFYTIAKDKVQVIVSIMESSMFFFWIGILIVCMISIFISYYQYKRLDVK